MSPNAWIWEYYLGGMLSGALIGRVVVLLQSPVWHSPYTRSFQVFFVLLAGVLVGHAVSREVQTGIRAGTLDPAFPLHRTVRNTLLSYTLTLLFFCTYFLL